MFFPRSWRRRAHSLAVFAFVWPWLVAFTTAEETPSGATPTVDLSTIPPAESTYLGRQIAQTMHYRGAPWLVRESREREEECSTLLKSLAIKTGDTVCDLGCGNGFYSLKLAELVGEEGKVLAVDIQREMLGLLRVRAEEAGVDNIELIHSTLTDSRLPEGQIDLVLLVDVYHEFSHPQQMLHTIRRSLNPRGRVALVEFRLEDPNVPIKMLHKMSKEQIMKEFPPNGFKLVGEFNRLPWQHVMFFARNDGPQKEMEPTPWREETGE